MRKFLALFLSLIMCVSVLSACANNGEEQSDNSGADTDEVWKIRIASTENDETPTARGVLLFNELVEERTEGRVTVEHIGNSAMGGEREITEAVVLGTLEGGLITSGLLSSYKPNWFFLDLPYVFVDRQEMWNHLDGEVGDFLKEETLDIGIEVLAYTDGSMRCVTNTKRPVESLADMAGLKLRVLENEVMIELFKAFGANPIPMAFGEVYTALQQGTIDGLDTPPIYVPDGKFQEVEKYYTQTDHQICCEMVIINSEFLASMPEDIQRIVRDSAYEACTIEERKLVLQAEEDAVKIMTDAGMTKSELSDEALAEFIQASRPIIDKYRDSIDTRLFEYVGL